MTKWCIAFIGHGGGPIDEVSSWNIWGAGFQKEPDPPEGKIRFWWHTKEAAEGAWIYRGHHLTHDAWCPIGYEVEDG